MSKIGIGGILLSFVACFTTGCLESSTLLTVNPDGSGTIAVREHFGPQMTEMMESMAAFADSMGSAMAEGMAGVQGEAGAATKPKSNAKKMDFIQQAIENGAEELGPGVKLVSSQKRTNAAGWKGYSAEYSFSDVTQLQVPKKQKASSSGGNMSMDGAGASYRFEFSKGQPATLRLIPVKKPAKKQGDETEARGAMAGTEGTEGKGAVKMNAAESPEMQQMVLSMMKGLRMAFFVRVNGTVTDTNAKFKSPKLANVFTVMDVNIDEVLKDQQAAKLLAAGDDASKAKLAKMTIPGMTVEDEDKTITISFK